MQSPAIAVVAAAAAAAAAAPSLPCYIVRLSGALAALLGRAEGVELPEHELLGRLRDSVIQAQSGAGAETGGRAAAAAVSVLAALLRPGAPDDTAYEGELLGRLRYAGLITYPSPLLGLVEELHEVFAAEVETVQVCFLRLYYVGLCACVQLH
jgi:hypothetical protein